MSIDTKAAIQEAIRASLDNAFVGLPVKIRPHHRARVEGVHKVTIWRRQRTGRITAPLRDELGPYWPNAQYRAELEQEMLDEARDQMLAEAAAL